MSGDSDKTVETPILSDRDFSAIAWAAVIAFIAGAVLVAMFWLGTSGYAVFPVSSEALEQSAHFGDAFGVINTMVSAAACVALVITLRMQARQMKDQEEDQRKAEEDRRINSETTMLAAYMGLLDADWESSAFQDVDTPAIRLKKMARRCACREQRKAIEAVLKKKLDPVIGTADMRISSIVSEMASIAGTLSEIPSIYGDNPQTFVADSMRLVLLQVKKAEGLFSDLLEVADVHITESDTFADTSNRIHALLNHNDESYAHYLDDLKQVVIQLEECGAMLAAGRTA